MQAFSYTRASDAADAIKTRAARPAAAYLAGGTTLVDLLKIDVMKAEAVIDINRIGLDRIEVLGDGRVRIGALVTNTDLAHHAEIVLRYQVLSEALLSGASTQLRNKATTAGNVMQRVRCGYFRDGVSPCNKRTPGSGCAAIGGHHRTVHAVLGTSEQCIASHPSDMCVAMAAIGAVVEVDGPQGKRQIPFADFHLLPGDTPWREHALGEGELITHIVLDAPIAGARSAYLKLRDRSSYQFALASSAVVVAVENGVVRDVRIALGGVATKPWRATAAEAALVGQAATPEVIARAAEAAMQGAIPRPQNAYKIPLGKQAIVRNLTTLLA